MLITKVCSLHSVVLQPNEWPIKLSIVYHGWSQQGLAWTECFGLRNLLVFQADFSSIHHQRIIELATNLRSKLKSKLTTHKPNHEAQMLNGISGLENYLKFHSQHVNNKSASKCSCKKAIPQVKKKQNMIVGKHIQESINLTEI